jgi:uncharacterized peroxidase-related enzyme
MAHIRLHQELPGILGLMAFRPETAKPLNELVDVLLRGPSSLPPGERELIASFVSSLNHCSFCVNTHGAMAAQQLPSGEQTVSAVNERQDLSCVSPKLAALLEIAALVNEDGRNVTAEAVSKARTLGATDLEIHDTEGPSRVGIRRPGISVPAHQPRGHHFLAEEANRLRS